MIMDSHILLSMVVETIIDFVTGSLSGDNL